MLIKGAENRSEDIAALKSLLKEPELTPIQRQAINDALDNYGKGAWGEHDASHMLNFHFHQSPSHLVLHDLQIILSDSRRAQINHLLVNSYQDIYVLESRNWPQLSVDRSGACTIGQDRDTGVPSPLEECHQNATILARAIQIDPELKALVPRVKIISKVLVPPRCQLDAPHHQEWFMRADAFFAQRTKELEVIPFTKVLDLPRHINHKALVNLGQVLLALHNPKKIDWRKRFDLAPPPPKGHVSADDLLAEVEGLAQYVPRWGDDWLVVHFPPGLPPLEMVKALKEAGYHANKHHGEWVWSLKDEARPEREERWVD